MEHILNKIHKSLIKNKKTVAVAESCTGGHLSCLLTSKSGSSGYFILGLVAYSNITKENILRIPHTVIAKNGAVSKIVASFMAENARKIAKTDFGIGLTGIAGPTGSAPGKPLGTVFIAVNSKKGTICRKFILKGSRGSIKKSAALKSLSMLSKLL